MHYAEQKGHEWDIEATPSVINNHEYTWVKKEWVNERIEGPN